MKASEYHLFSKIFFISLMLYVSTGNLRSQEYAQETWRFVPNLNNIGKANMISMDINSDGVKELIYSSRGPGSLFKILGHINGNYNEVYTSELFTKEISWMEVNDQDEDGNFNLFLAMEDQKILVFDLQTQKFTDTIDLAFNVIKFFIIDADNNGETEILGYNESGIYSMNMNGNLGNKQSFRQ